MAGTRGPSAIRIRTGKGPAYEVRFGPLAGLPASMREAGLRVGRCLLVSDQNVTPLYGVPLRQALADDGWDVRAVTLPPGEATKSTRWLSALHDAALEWGVDRSTPLLAVGGGVVGDLAGFAAATLLRGIPLVQVPTTLIAQVDSAIGGKTGINHPTGKNLIGAFHPPRLVWSDPSTLSTLPEREWTGGLSEVYKHALIGDPGLFDRLLANHARLVERDPAVVGRVIRAAAMVKARIVERDEMERGERAILNFGHTFAHALELSTGYGTISHGEAVAFGMRAAIRLSRRDPEFAGGDAPRAEQLVGLLRRTAVPDAIGPEELLRAMQSDKKADAGRPRFVLLRRVGTAYVTDEVTPAEVEDACRHAIER